MQVAAAAFASCSAVTLDGWTLAATIAADQEIRISCRLVGGRGSSSSSLSSRRSSSRKGVDGEQQQG